ncbi:hypothetical protein [Rhizobium sp. RCC_161_2]|uniref:hypothetical protein n=1 Tax=Rhizobium sp. RCC_161_2 TaxID=3239219 RepID=UPI0035239A05
MHTKYLHGRTEAHEIETRLNVAYYLSCAGKASEARGHYEGALNEFEQLAVRLGYRVERIADEPARVPEISPRGSVHSVAAE